MVDLFSCNTVVGEPAEMVFVLALEPAASNSETSPSAEVQKSFGVVVRYATSMWA